MVLWSSHVDSDRLVETYARDYKNSLTLNAISCISGCLVMMFY